MKKSRYFPSLEEFRDRARKGNVIPVYRDILADTETPVSAFMKIDDGGEAFLLESVEGGEKWGRFSFLGTGPRATIRSKGDTIEIIEGRDIKRLKGDPLDELKRFMAPYRSVDVKGAPRFSGGAIGYIGYDMVRHIEKLPSIAKRDLDIYDLFMILTDTLLVFDNVEHTIKVIANAYIDKGSDIDRVYHNAVERIEGLVERLRTKGLPETRYEGSGPTKISSNFKKEDFVRAVEKVKDYIYSGDIIQAVISQRFSTPLDTSPFTLYRALRVINPSPYMFFLRLGGLTLVGSSPEILVRVEGDEINVRPIAGTRPRGATEDKDTALERDLLSDPKERAEHIMLVDLGRNDVGRIARPGTVSVDELMAVERYSHVMHIVSNVHGLLREDRDAFDALRACFPAGTLTGAPKIRAMEIIEELEPCRRGVYGGSVGYFGFSGAMDMCIAIRTMVIKDSRIYVQAGAGIVADSDPELEYEETRNKAKAMFKAVELARRFFA